MNTVIFHTYTDRRKHISIDYAADTQTQKLHVMVADLGFNLWD